MLARLLTRMLTRMFTVDKDVLVPLSQVDPVSTLESSLLRVNLMAIKAKSLLLTQAVELDVTHQHSSPPTQAFLLYQQD